MDLIQNFIDGFYNAVIYDQRYLVYLDGLKVTILISLFAIAIGVAIGLLIAVIKVSFGKESVGWLEMALQRLYNRDKGNSGYGTTAYHLQFSFYCKRYK